MVYKMFLVIVLIIKYIGICRLDFVLDSSGGEESDEEFEFNRKKK